MNQVMSYSMRLTKNDNETLNSSPATLSYLRMLLPLKRNVKLKLSILVNNQLDTQLFFFRIYLFQFSTCFEHPRAHHQENQLY
jgi:hypothetical protein